MSTLVINYNSLNTIARNASDLARKAEEYANNLTSKVSNKFGEISGGSTTNTANAKYYVSSKIKELQNKKNAYKSLSTQVTTFIDTAKRVDAEVARTIANSQEKFLQKHENLRIDGWKANLLNWLVDLKNSCPLFEMIGNALEDFGTGISGLLANIRYWYKCEGGKNIVGFVLAIGGAIVAVLLFIASFPASGFLAICAAIGAAITAINALTNVYTSYKAMKSDDPAWAKIYGDQNKLSDVFRQENLHNGFLNRISYGAATLLDATELFCDVVNILNLVSNFKSKFSFIQNFFDKNTGLLSYMKTAKWTDALQYDEYGNIVGTMKVMKTNKYGIVETRYTFSSVWNGIKAYVMDSPIDCHTETGIRTLLHNNFVTDFKDWKNSVFSITAWKDTFKYRVTDGGRISYSEWKSTFNISAFKDTLRFNLKNNALKGMFADSVKWKYRKDFISSTANGINSFMDMSTKVGSMVVGEYSISSEIKSYLESKKTGFSDTTKIIEKINKLKVKFDSVTKNSYIYKDRYART